MDFNESNNLKYMYYSNLFCDVKLALIVIVTFVNQFLMNLISVYLGTVRHVLKTKHFSLSYKHKEAFHFTKEVTEYCKSRILRMGEINISYALSLKMHKIPRAYGKKNENFREINEASAY